MLERRPVNRPGFAGGPNSYEGVDDPLWDKVHAAFASHLNLSN